MSIPKPKHCDQNWLKMQEVQDGRICGKCENILIDFRKKSWQEVRSIQYQSAHTTCGIYSKKQLNNWDPINEKSRGLNIAAASVLLGMSQLIGNNAAAQVKPTQIQTIHKSTDTLNNFTKTIEHTATVRGRVIDKETGEVLPFVKIEVEGKEIYGTTDFDGNFQIKYPLVGMEKVNLILTYPSFQTQTVQDIILYENRITTVNVEMTSLAASDQIIAFYVTVPSKREERKAKRKAEKEARQAQKKEQ